MGFLSGLFGGKGYKNPADSANKYIDQIPGQTSQYFQPYINAGQNALPQLQGQYNDLLNNPGGKLNQMGGQFQQSPGFQFALQQALQGSGHAAAAGGMAGSPQHEMQNMGIATQLGNQDYYNYLDKTLGLYNKGLEGEQGMAQGGLTAGTSMADMISQALAQHANYDFRGQQDKNARKNDLWSGLGNFGGAALGAFFHPGG